MESLAGFDMLKRDAGDHRAALHPVPPMDVALHGGGYVVTWAVGHLVALAQPHEMNPEWRFWRRDLLPMLPKQ